MAGLNSSKSKDLSSKIWKFSSLTAFLVSIAMTILVLFAGYIYIKTWTPIKEFSAKKVRNGSFIALEYSVKVPVTGYVLYGTNPVSVNKKEFGGKVLDKGQLVIGPVLQDRPHFVRFVAQTEDGRSFKTPFLEVK